MLEKKMQKDLQNLGFSRMPKQIEYLSMSEIVSEFAEFSIEEYLNTPGIPDKLTFAEILVQMIEAVEEMHSYGFIHQDIKLDNYRIMNNRVVLIDFGITTSYKEADGKHKILWRQGFAGTPFNGSVRALQGY
jgi:serine/threonine protein kinase